MKKRIAFIVMLLSIASSQIASADSGVVSASSLNIRQKPSLSSSIMGSLSKNTMIDTLGKEGDFYKISYKGKTGYICKTYIKIVKSTSASKNVPSVKSTYIEKYGQITATDLNVRSGSGITYPVTGSIKFGSKVTMYENSNGFYKIIYGGKTGYISSLYVKVIGQKTINSSSTSLVTTPVTIPVITPTITPELKSTGVGTITASDFLSVRKTASLGNDSFAIGRIYPNQKVELYGEQDGFYRIKFSGQLGYIYKSYVSVDKTSLTEAEYVADGQQYDTGTTGAELVTYANTFLGTPYVWGGAMPAKFNACGEYISGGFDCSGFVQYIYKNFGVNLPRITTDQVDKGISVDINSLQKGDLVFFMTNTAAPTEVSHVGIYIGNNKFTHCPKPGDVVKISELAGYYKENFVIGKRIIK
ncbi:SH3 domain-containing protein [Clostridium sp.]|uniref:C40 family peptidase n=1 Tax=Clostridium sp. TaxID=1506 RepID=UPI003D6CD475